jgi:hypothetical protein
VVLTRALALAATYTHQHHHQRRRCCCAARALRRGIARRHAHAAAAPTHGVPAAC